MVFSLENAVLMQTKYLQTNIANVLNEKTEDFF